MTQDILVNIALAFGLLFVGAMFLEGYFSGKHNTRFRVIINLDRVFFRNLKDAYANAADKLAFFLCAIMAALTALNALLIFLLGAPNISAPFVFLGFFGSWIIRFVFILIFKDKPIEKIPGYLRAR